MLAHFLGGIRNTEVVRTVHGGAVYSDRQGRAINALRAFGSYEEEAEPAKFER